MARYSVKTKYQCTIDCRNDFLDNIQGTRTEGE